MALFEIIFFIVFPFLFLSLQPSTSVEICPIACGHQSIRFPFRLNSQPEHCGYPRFNLSCRHDTQTILTLPFSGDFIVQLDIDYLFQIIWIDDPDNCIARRLLKGLNLSGTPFKLLDPENYLFLNCRHDVTTHIPRMIYIPCLGGDSFSVVAVPAEIFYMYPSLWSCAKMATVSMPALDPNYGMSLTWNEPDCMSCERRAGTCTFKSSTSLDIGCFGGFSTGLSEGTKYGIAFGVGIPLLCILWLVFYLHRKANNYNNIHHHRQLNPEISIPVAPRRLDADAKGLDRPTIDTYPITLLGECRRLPNPKDNTCSICLCEYQAKEALRTIPDCKHYFHVSCIDEWLKLNASCPLCRYVTEGSASSSFSSQ